MDAGFGRKVKTELLLNNYYDELDADINIFLEQTDGQLIDIKYHAVSFGVDACEYSALIIYTVAEI